LRDNARTVFHKQPASRRFSVVSVRRVIGEGLPRLLSTKS